jgi:hypothetical protein
MKDDPKACGLQQQPYFIQKDRLTVPHLFEHVHLSVSPFHNVRRKNYIINCGSIVVKALCCKPEGGGFKAR